MAKYDDRKNAALAVALRRQSSSPLDVSSVFNSIADFEAYVKQDTNYGPYSDGKENTFLQKINPYSYAGQVVTVLDAAAGSVKTFVINKAGPLGTGSIDTNVQRLDGATGPHIRYNNGSADVDLVADTWYYSAYNKKYFKFDANGAYQIVSVAPSGYSAENAIPESVTEFETTIGGQLQNFKFTEDVKERYTEVGSVPAVDGKSIKTVDVVTADGKTVKTLEISGTSDTLADIADKGVGSEEGQYAAGTTFQLTLDLNGNVRWVKVDTQTMEGVASTLESYGKMIENKVDKSTFQDAVNDHANDIARIQPILDNAANDIAKIHPIVNTVSSNYVKDVAYNNATGTFTFNYVQNNAIGNFSVDLALERIVTNFFYTSDGNTPDGKVVYKNNSTGVIGVGANVPDGSVKVENSLVLELTDGTDEAKAETYQAVSLSKLIDTYTGESTNTIAVTVSGNTISADIKANAINANNAGTIFADNAITSAILENKIADRAITADIIGTKIAENAINSPTLITIIENNAFDYDVLHDKIATDAIDESILLLKVANNAITGDILENKIANNAITSDVLEDKLADGAINFENLYFDNKIASNSIHEAVFSDIVKEQSIYADTLFAKIVPDSLNNGSTFAGIFKENVIGTNEITRIIAANSIDQNVANKIFKSGIELNITANYATSAGSASTAGHSLSADVLTSDVKFGFIQDEEFVPRKTFDGSSSVEVTIEDLDGVRASEHPTLTIYAGDNEVASDTGVQGIDGFVKDRKLTIEAGNFIKITAANVTENDPSHQVLKIDADAVHRSFTWQNRNGNAIAVVPEDDNCNIIFKEGDNVKFDVVSSYNHNANTTYPHNNPGSYTFQINAKDTLTFGAVDSGPYKHEGDIPKAIATYVQVWTETGDRLLPIDRAEANWVGHYDDRDLYLDVVENGITTKHIADEAVTDNKIYSVDASKIVSNDTVKLILNCGGARRA